MATITLTRLTEDDREQFILDNQRAFRYGAMEEFGCRDDHMEEYGGRPSKKVSTTALPTASGRTEAVSPTEEPAPLSTFAELRITGYDGFCDVLPAKLIDGSKNSNLSPISVYLALAMVADGAKGDTQTAMLKLLGCESIEELRGVCGDMLNELSVDTETRGH